MAKDLTGRSFGMLLVRRKADDGRWICDCECGGEITADRRSLASGQVKRCGCIAAAVKAMPVAGLKGLGGAPLGKIQSERQNWYHMISRCCDSNHAAWRHYGGRGIEVCEEWRNSFEAFYAHIGPKPGPKHTIERIDVNGNYEPGNVRWATKKEQARNKRNTVWVLITAGLYQGQIVSLAEAAEKLGLTRKQARGLLNRKDGLVQAEGPRQAA